MNQHNQTMKQDLLPFYPFITHPAQADRLFTPPGSGLPTLYEQVEQQQCGIFMSDKNENTETALRRGLCFALSEKTIMSYH